MRKEIIKKIFLIFILWVITGTSKVKMDIKKLPQEERKLLNSVDPWGLAFSDQLKRYLSYFKNVKRDFVVGYTHNLVKIWQNKYWFRGKIVGKDNLEPLWGVPGSTVSFQTVILPEVGAEKGKYYVKVKSPVEIKFFGRYL